MRPETFYARLHAFILAAGPAGVTGAQQREHFECSEVQMCSARQRMRENGLSVWTLNRGHELGGGVYFARAEWFKEALAQHQTSMRKVRLARDLERSASEHTLERRRLARARRNALAAGLPVPASLPPLDRTKKPKPETRAFKPDGHGPVVESVPLLVSALSKRTALEQAWR